MDGKQKSKPAFPEENLFMNAGMESLKPGQAPDQADSVEALTGSTGGLLRNGLLASYATTLSTISSGNIYPVILTESIRIFNLSGAFFSIYDPETADLSIKVAMAGQDAPPVISQLFGPEIKAFGIRIEAERYNQLCHEPFRFYSNLHALTHGAIPEAFAREIETAAGPGWFTGLNLIYNKELQGTISFIGTDSSALPDRNELGIFLGITSNALARVMAEEASAASGIRFRQLIDEAPVAYHSLHADGTLSDVNQAWLDLLGYDREEIIGRHLGEILSGRSKIDFLDGLSHLMKSETIIQELEVLTRDGNVLIFDVAVKAGKDDKGNLKQLHCILNDITSKRKSEELFREREEVFEAITSYTTNWESWFDNSGKIIWTNPLVFSFTGYTPSEILAMPDYINTLVAEEDRERVASVLLDALKGKDRSSVEFTCIRKDQTRFRISVSWNHIFDRQGKAMGIRSSGHDITSYREAEEAFTFTESLYKQMIENAPFGMHFYQVDESGRLILTGANAAANKILGIDHTQLFGLSIEQAFPSLSGTDIIGHYLDAALHNKIWLTDQIEYTDNRISGAFEVKAFQTVPGRMVALFSDITKRKQAERDLEESRQLFETLARVSPVGIFRTDAKGETTFVNPKWISLTGLSFKDALESKFMNALHPDDREECIAEWRQAVEKGESVVSEYRFLRPDGSIVWVQGHAVPEIADGKIKGFIGTITDISDLKKAEAEMLKAKEKAEASDRFKTTFMGNISHEIRTPLNGIIGFAELISSGNNSEEENLECIEFLNHSINRLTKIIDNIMDVSMMMSGNATIKPEIFSIDELVQQAWQKFEIHAARKNLNFSVDKQGTGQANTILSDRLMLSRIINELVDNAIKFTKSGSVTISYGVDDQILSLKVSDSGTGISKEMLPFIFEPFIQDDVYAARVNNSNGLGLAIVYEAIGILGGTVAAESTPGVGTSISISVPVTSPEEDNVSLQAPVSAGTGKKSPVVLIVEDEEINMIYLRRLLSQEGYSILMANNAPDAFESLEQNQGIDLILMDMKMPGMDGFEATRKIKSLYPDIRIAAVTAYAGDTDRDLCFAAGCDDYIAKPFQKSELNQLLKRMIK